jgi:monoamine oxidase
MNTNLISYKLKSELSILIIGAGASGLSCCNKLLSKGFTNIKILEASNTIGGRLRKLPKEQGFADIDIDLGGEEIHGNESEYFKLVQENGGEIFEYWEENKFYINYRDQFESLDEMIEKQGHKDLKFIWETFDDISYELTKDYPDVTLRKFLEMNNISEDVYPLANAMLAVEAGTDIDHISVYGFNKVCRDWLSGISNYFLKNCSHVDIIRKAFSSALEKVVFNTQVVNVNYPENKNNDFSQSKIKVSTSDDKIFECDILIITVPIMILKNLNFEPKLPAEHQKAIETLKMDNVGKLLLKFKKCLWPDDCSYLIIPGLINCYWSPTLGKSSNNFILTGFTAGKECRTLNKLHKEDKDKFIDRILTELADGIKLDKNYLMDNFEDFIFFDWCDMPFIRGGYTYPIVNERDERSVLRQSLNDKIFFAGEATAEFGHIGTIHGAIESGYRVAESINSLFIKNDD